MLGAHDACDAAAPTLDWELIALVLLLACHVACCWRLSPPLPCPSLSFLAARKTTLAIEMLAMFLALGTHAVFDAAFFIPAGGINFGILEDGGPPGETGRATVPDG